MLIKDVAAFSGESFDPKEWINNAFRVPEAQANKEVGQSVHEPLYRSRPRCSSNRFFRLQGVTVPDHLALQQFASSLITKLQLLIAKLNSSLEEQCHQVSGGLLRSRVLRDVESLQQEALLLQANMAEVREELAKANVDPGKSMQTLVQMDELKQRIQAKSKALKEADNWTTLTGEIEEAMDNVDLPLISLKLNGIQNSLRILTHVPDYQDRVSRLFFPYSAAKLR